VPLIFNFGAFLMDKNATDSAPIENAADFVDSLLRPAPEEKPVKWKFIEGRRMRDRFVGEVIVPSDMGDVPE
jgi:hypothetical protein